MPCRVRKADLATDAAVDEDMALQLCQARKQGHGSVTPGMYRGWRCEVWDGYQIPSFTLAFGANTLNSKFRECKIRFGYW